MDRTEETFISMFFGLREELRGDTGIGLALKAEGPAITLRIRSERQEDERQPYFAIVVGVAEREGAFRISYKPSGLPAAGRQVTIVDAGSTEELLGLVRRHVDAERRRLTDYRRGT